MSDMFTNYEYIPDGYVPDNRHEKQIAYKPEKLPYEVKNIKGETIGFGWNYRDRVVLEFHTCGDVEYDDGHREDAETYMNKSWSHFKLTFFNFRFEVVHEDLIPASTVCKYEIGEELQKILIPNTYSIQLDLIPDDESTAKTLIDRRDLKIFVR